MMVAVVVRLLDGNVRLVGVKGACNTSYLGIGRAGHAPGTAVDQTLVVVASGKKCNRYGCKLHALYMVGVRMF